jgi:hypothetical protein
VRVSVEATARKIAADRGAPLALLFLFALVLGLTVERLGRNLFPRHPQIDLKSFRDELEHGFASLPGIFVGALPDEFLPFRKNVTVDAVLEPDAFSAFSKEHKYAQRVLDELPRGSFTQPPTDRFLLRTVERQVLSRKIQDSALLLLVELSLRMRNGYEGSGKKRMGARDFYAERAEFFFKGSKLHDFILLVLA